MKRKWRKFFALSLAVALVLMCSSFSSVSAEDNVPAQQVPEEIQQAMEMQIPALDAYCKLKSNLEVMPISNEADDLYAGEYIAGDKLVIQLVNATASDTAVYQSLTGNSEYVMFAEAQYSLKQLEGYEEVASSLSEEYDIISYGIDIRNNRFLLTVSDDDYDDLLLDEVLLENQEVFLVETSGDDRPVTCATSLYGGDRISKNSSSMADSYMSICIGGTYGGKDAILTAGHNNEGSPNYYRSGNLIGKVAYQRCNTKTGDTSVNSLGDFAIITLNSSFNPTNYVRNSSSTVPITGTYSSLPVGTVIYKYGSTTGYSWGPITYTNVTVTYTDIFGFTTYQVRGLYQSSLQNSSSTHAIDGGDSGGCVYIKEGSSYKIHGSVSGMRKSSSGVNSIMYSSPIYYAQDAGFSPKLN